MILLQQRLENYLTFMADTIGDSGSGLLRVSYIAFTAHHNTLCTNSPTLHCQMSYNVGGVRPQPF